MKDTEPGTYVGSDQDLHGGMTDTGKIIRDAWVFGIIPQTETCAGWTGDRIEALWAMTAKEWEKYGYLVGNLPAELKKRFLRIQNEAVARAEASGWDPYRDLFGDDD